MVISILIGSATFQAKRSQFFMSGVGKPRVTVIFSFPAITL
jgi:hypothetical protein